MDFAPREQLLKTEDQNRGKKPRRANILPADDRDSEADVAPTAPLHRLRPIDPQKTPKQTDLQRLELSIVKNEIESILLEVEASDAHIALHKDETKRSSNKSKSRKSESKQDNSTKSSRTKDGSPKRK